MDGKDIGGYELAEEVTGLGRGTLYSMVSRRVIPHFRLGPRLVKFSREHLETWMSANLVRVTDGAAS